MDLGLEGKAALVTGANRGIGMAIAKGLAREGCDVAMCSRDEQSIQAAAREVEEQTKAKTIGIAADVLKPDDASRLVDTAIPTVSISNDGAKPSSVPDSARSGGSTEPRSRSTVCSSLNRPSMMHRMNSLSTSTTAAVGLSEERHPDGDATRSVWMASCRSTPR